MMFGLDENGINSICLSSLSYEEKIKLLEQERNYVHQTLGIIDNAIYNLENGSYLEAMLKRKEEIANKIKVDKSMIGIGAGNAIVSVGMWNVMSKYAENNPNSDLYCIFVFLVCLAAGFTFCGINEIIKDNKTYNQYDENIEKYQKILK